MQQILIFTALQIVNVILSVMKSIIQIKGGKILASLFNAFYFAFYIVIVIYMVADIQLWVKMLITFFSNLFGTFIAMTILDKVRRDKLWKIDAVVSSSDADSIHAALKDISHTYIIVTHSKTVFTFYCMNKDQSRRVRDLLKEKSAQYFVSENKANLF